MTDVVTDESFDANEAFVIAGEFKDRAGSLRQVGHASLAAIFLLIFLAIIWSYYADSITASQFDVIDQKLTFLVKAQSDLSADITPRLVPLIRNANSFDQIVISRNLRAMKRADFNYERDAGTVNYYDSLRIDQFASERSLVDFLDRLLSDSTHPVTVIKITLPLIGIDPRDYPDLKMSKKIEDAYYIKFFGLLDDLT